MEKNEQPEAVQREQEDLVELEPDTESTIYKRILAPKVIILTFLSLMFISKNIYNFYMAPPAVPPSPPPVADEPAKQDDPLMDRMYGYCILTAVLLVLYILMVRANDRALIQKIQEEKAKLAEQQQRKRQETNKSNSANEDRDEVLQQNVEVK